MQTQILNVLKDTMTLDLLGDSTAVLGEAMQSTSKLPEADFK